MRFCDVDGGFSVNT